MRGSKKSGFCNRMNRPLLYRENIPDLRVRALRKHPPYSSVLTGRPRQITIFTGPRAWDHCRHVKATRRDWLVLPPGDLPDSYSWPVRGADVIIFRTVKQFADQQITELARECFLSGARTIYITGPGETAKWFFDS